MEWRFANYLHPLFFNVVTLNETPLKSFVMYLELKETKNVTHFLLLKAHSH